MKWSELSARVRQRAGLGARETNAVLRALLDEVTEVVVNTEFNFYLVKMSRSTGPAIEVEYRLASGETASGRRDTRGVSLEISPLAEPDKPDFSLLGLHGAITLLFAGDQALPLQLRGTAPRLGSAEITLRAATLRPDAPGKPGPGRASAAEQGK